MLMRPEWFEPEREPPTFVWREPPGRVLTTLFWTCIVLSLAGMLVLF